MNKWKNINLPFGPIYDNKSIDKKFGILRNTKNKNDQEKLNNDINELYDGMDSFYKRKLNIPGTLIETEDGEQFLIGHINTIRGVCDDCTMFEPDTIVKRYKVVWIEKKK